jgi:D-tyrosyl-tRNA(Tyr) deacylase
LRALVQRVSEARVSVDGEVVGEIGTGLVVLVGVGLADSEAEARRLAGKVAALRVFDDDEGRMGRSLLDLGDGGAALCISQFTLYGDVRRGTRPSFTEAAEPQRAVELYEQFCGDLAGQGVRVETGTFGARMSVGLTNEGPVTVLLEV